MTERYEIDGNNYYLVIPENLDKCVYYYANTNISVNDCEHGCELYKTRESSYIRCIDKCVSEPKPHPCNGHTYINELCVEKDIYNKKMYNLTDRSCASAQITKVLTFGDGVME